MFYADLSASASRCSRCCSHVLAGIETSFSRKKRGFRRAEHGFVARGFGSAKANNKNNNERRKEATNWEVSVPRAATALPKLRRPDLQRSREAAPTSDFRWSHPEKPTDLLENELASKQLQTDYMYVPVVPVNHRNKD
jgi:hypothetical protein